MKAKTQLRIGLYTAVVSIASIIIFFPLHFMVTKDILWDSVVVILQIIVFPAAYAVALTIKKLKVVRVIFRIWCIAWIISFVFVYLMGIPHVSRWVNNLIPSSICCPTMGLEFFLEAVVLLPTAVWFFLLLHLLFSYVEVLPLPIIYAACGWLFMLLLWTGVRGLKEMSHQEKSKSN